MTITTVSLIEAPPPQISIPPSPPPTSSHSTTEIASPHLVIAQGTSNINLTTTIDHLILIGGHQTMERRFMPNSNRVCCEIILYSMRYSWITSDISSPFSLRFLRFAFPVPPLQFPRQQRLQMHTLNTERNANFQAIVAVKRARKEKGVTELKKRSSMIIHPKGIIVEQGQVSVQKRIWKSKKKERNKTEQNKNMGEKQY